MDFLVKYTWIDDKFKAIFDEPPVEQPHVDSVWILHVDGTTNSQGSRVGMILANSEGEVAKYALCFLFKATNN